ncbi:MAG: oligosaccharide flippase family protein [Saprospiraceae bacterium]|nr:oligosaccharide flippase family protein [Saprospiraceae bacterium]
MNREFLLNAAFLVLVNVLIKPFYVFGIERTVQERVGPEQYGLYATLFSFTFLLFMVNDFGIHYFNNRTIARHPQLIGKYFPNILVVKTLLTVMYLVLVFLAALVRGFEPAIFHLIFFIALNHVFISMVAFLRSNISGLGMYRTDSLVSTLDKLLLIGACSVLLWSPFWEGKFRIEWFIHAQNLTWG